LTAVAELVARSRAEQGLPKKITDRVVLDAIVAAVEDTDVAGQRARAS
jgi:hypothetical protein